MHVYGRTRIPGDKSLTHRALYLAALALLVLTAGLVVLANELTAFADDVPTKAEKKAKRKDENSHDVCHRA